jgi:hypothetical protein
MGARFAGSQRLGDRRRRRLAVETDDLPLDAIQRRPLPGPSESARAIEAPHTGGAPGAADVSFDRAISGLVPRQWWKYLTGGLTCATFAGGLLVAGACAADLGSALGPGIERLFAFPEAPVAKWFSSLLLTTAAQLALLIWWARSQSDKDFDGRYWLWIRITFGWFLFSGCVAADAADAVTSTMRYLWPQISGQTATLGWLIPAAAAGAGALLSLAREMRDCRWSHAFLLAGALAYISVAVLQLGLETSLTPSVRLQSQNALLLAGHAAAALSMWLHARHVLYCTVDPAASQKSRWTIPRPHFRLPRLGWIRTRASEPQTAASSGSRRKRPTRPVETESHPAASPEAGNDDILAQGTTAANQRLHFRIDNQPDRMRPNPAEAARQPVGAATGRDAATGNSTAATAGSQSPDAVAENVRPTQNDFAESPPGEPEDPTLSAGEMAASSKPDLRGLSKKQRRRLMQELRERERAADR